MKLKNTTKYSRWIAVAALAVAGVASLSPVRADAPAANAQVVKLRTDAIRDFTAGKFDAGSDLLAQAAKLSNDNETAEMLKWSDQFRDQLNVFTGERHKAYDKAVADVKTLTDKGHADYAMDFADRAQLLSDDKKAFVALPWVQKLIADGADRAKGYEAGGDWYTAMRVYRDLAAVDPASKEWKEKLKDVTRRVRLIATYNPDLYKSTLDGETKEREQIDALVNPDTHKPTTKPAEAVENDNFKIDWHDTLKGIEMPMLVQAMADANDQYYRQIDYKTLMTGGLSGIEAVVSTKGLEKTFPNLADEKKKAEFQAALDGWKAMAAGSNADTMEGVSNTILGDGPDGMLAVNARTLQLPDAVLISEYADGAFAGLDPFTSMIWPSELAEFTKATQGQFSGIGIQIETDDEGNLKVVRPLTGSPAAAAGIKSLDVIAKINGKNARNITADQAVKYITGPAGTVVNITVRSPDGTMTDMNIRRASIHVESVEGYSRTADDKWNYYVDPDNKIAYIRITSFSGSTRAELAKVLEKLGDDVNGVIVDLRGNPGGLLTAATGVCDQFLSKGVIVSTHPDRETRNPKTMSTAEDDHARFERLGADLPVCDKPMVVLINQYSASASEIVSGCLKDDHRAILVGERSFGKGSVQQIFPPENSDAKWKITTAHYYLPSGRCIHREENSTEWGVDPDVVVEMTPEQMRAAAIARQDMEMDRAANAAPAEGMRPKLNDTAKPGPANGEPVKTEAATTEPMAGGATTQPVVHKTLLEADPQLSAALLVLRLEVVGKTTVLADGQKP
jgi:carboxyl-terminal processing protease